MSLMDNFPFPEARSEQNYILDVMDRHWNDPNIKVYIVNAPTGVGKSAIAASVFRNGERAIVLTDDKTLQTQYQSDFNDLVDLRGKNNFICDKFHHKNTEMTAADAPCVASKTLIKMCSNQGICSYINARNRAMASYKMVTNYSMFFLMNAGAFGSNGGDAPLKAKNIICDEGHILCEKLTETAKIEINVDFLYRSYKIALSDEDVEVLSMCHEPDDLRECLNITVMEHAKTNLNRVDMEINDLGFQMDPYIKNNEDIPAALSKDAEIKEALKRRLVSLIQRLAPFINYPEDEWITFNETDKKGNMKITIAPMYPKRFFTDYMSKIGERIIIMSASIGDASTFMDELGLTKENTVYIETASPFDPEKSPIFFIPKVDMRAGAIDRNLPTMLEWVDDIMLEHHDVKGIIHTGNYKVAQYILENSAHKRRMIGKQSLDKISNSELSDRHALSEEPTVLVSPSMHTGVDLKGDLSRFQIIAKCPYRYLGDPYVAAKSNASYNWYLNELWKTIIQASGRSTRTEDDESYTYVLDTAISKAYKNFKRKLPEWFKDRIIEDS